MRSGALLSVLIAALLLSACAVRAPAAATPGPATAPDAQAEATPEPSAAPAQEATAAAPAGEPGEATAATPASLDEAALDALLTQWLTPGNGLCDAPGAVLLVDSPAGRYLKAMGVASLDDQRPLATGDRLQIGSNTKAFTVILALQLQEAGVLSMDDPLSKWLPDLAAQIPNAQEVTLRQLAGNTSGIPDYADPLMQPLVDANDQEGLAQPFTPQALVEFAIANGKPDFEPGEGWHYSSTNFILLGMAVEAATGKPLAELYQVRIFDPLGMATTSYLEGSPEPGSQVDGYYTVPGGALTNMTGWNATQGGAAGAIVSTAEDMARFAQGLFGGKLFQDDATLAEMTGFRALDYGEGGGVFAGYGLGLINFETNGFTAIGHAGQTPGFQSLWFWAPEAQASFVLLTNSGSCRVTFMPSSLTPAMFGLEAIVQESSFCANYELPFPRPEPDTNAKRARDLTPFAGSLAALTEERRAELDALLAEATILDMQAAMAGGKLNAEDAANRAPYGQGYLEQSQNAPLSDEDYLAAKEANQSQARDALASLFADNDIDVLISDVGQAYAPAGFPAMTVPIGYGPEGQPLGLTMVADYLGEPSLIAVGHALEQAAQARKAADLEETMKQIKATGNEAAASGQAAGDGSVKPAYVADLEASYGPPSQAGFGSAVFYEPLAADDSLADAALAKYKTFTGELWERWGEEAWMGPWKEVFARPAGAKPDIVAELRGITDIDARNSAPMILDVVQDAEQAKAALAAAFDDPAVTELRVFNLGDGGAMSGILVAGRRAGTADATFLVFLLD